MGRLTAQRVRWRRKSPEHFVEMVKVHSLAVVHEGEADLAVDDLLVNPQLAGRDIGVVGIVCVR